MACQFWPARQKSCHPPAPFLAELAPNRPKEAILSPVGHFDFLAVFVKVPTTGVVGLVRLFTTGVEMMKRRSKATPGVETAYAWTRNNGGLQPRLEWKFPHTITPTQGLPSLPVQAQGHAWSGNNNEAPKEIVIRHDRYPLLATKSKSTKKFFKVRK